MPAIQSITIADGKSTPANHTFVPYTAQRGSEPAVWYNKETDTSLGYRQITASVTTRANGTSKVMIKISDPVLAVINGACCVDANTPKVSYTEIATLEFNLPVGSTVANRKDILAYAKNFLGLAVATQLIVDLEPQF